MAKTPKTETEEPLKKKLWKSADKLRKNMDAAEYKYVALGLIFLKYISDAFEELYQKLKGEISEGADPEDKNEYIAEKVFFVPQLPDGITSKAGPHSLLLAKTLTMPWMLLNMTTHRCGAYCQKYLHRRN